VALLYAGAIVLWAVAAALAGAGLAFFVALVLVAVQFAWQLATLVTEDAANCLKRFRSNQLVGWILCLGLILDLSSRVRF
jgi:4-hydroxybenzoate polyprenyltransferase